jgi:hypothetical protein
LLNEQMYYKKLCYIIRIFINSHFGVLDTW